MSPENGNRRAGNAAAHSVGSNAAELSRLALHTQDQINQPVMDPATIWSVYLIRRGNGLGENVWLSDDEIAQYNANPDRFAATYFGFATVEEYREWVGAENAALCSERTKSGRLCRNSIGMTYRPEDWRQRHRSGPCFRHAKGDRS